LPDLIQPNVLLATQCRFEVGGAADYFAAVNGAEQLAEALDFARERGLRVFVYSGGSNLFFADAGFRGLVIRVVDGGWKVEERKLPESTYINHERSSPRKPGQNADTSGGADTLVCHPELRQSEDDFRVYQRRLPHWRMTNSTYFLTWRLHPSRSTLTADDRDIVVACLRYYKDQQYRLLAYVVMDDHVHVIVDLLPGFELHQVVKSWKGVSARRINQAHGTIGSLWQDETWDRIVRTEEELYEKLHYILNNPLKRWPDEVGYQWTYCYVLDERQTRGSAPPASQQLAESGHAGKNARPTGELTSVVKVSAGYDLPMLVRELAQQDLGGIEFLGNIPGSVGGAVVGNAGCYGRAIAEVFVEADVFDIEENRSFMAGPEFFEFSYRHSKLKFDPRYIVLAATLRLSSRPSAEILGEVEGELGDRLAKHPHFAACAGSFFKNHSGYPAWRVIADAGLNGAYVGGARLHDKHANFLVNEGGTAGDILALARRVMATVKEKLGLDLEPEVRYVGEFGIEPI
jgi:UDP-N-acetylenolpyruvoylglucosamine reductase